MIVAGALLLDRVATNSDLHHLAPLRSNNFFRPSWMRSAVFLATEFRGRRLHGRRQTGMQLNAGTSSTRLSLANAPEAKEIPVWLSQLRQSRGGSGRKKKTERPEPETEIRSRLARVVVVLQRCTDWLQRQERGENVVVNSLQTRHGRWCYGFLAICLPTSCRDMQVASHD
jgi:hypothetical protein